MNISLKISSAFSSRLLLVCGLLPVIGGFVFVFLFGTNTLFWDEWIVAPFLQNFAAGTLSFSDLFSQHNEHRMLFPRMIQLLVVGLTRNYNSITFMYLVQFCLLLLLFVLYRQAKRQFMFEGLPLWFLPIPLLVFNWRQWENMLSGFQITFVMPLLFGMLAFYFLDSCTTFQPDKFSTQKCRSFAWAVCSATIASYSMSMGLFVWIAGIVHLLLAKRGQSKTKFILLWIVLAGIEWRLYFFDTSLRSLLHPAPSGFEAALYGKAFFSLLGAFFYDESHALFYGIGLLLLFCMSIGTAWQQRMLRDHAFWVASGVYAFCILAAITFGRAPSEQHFFMWSRYQTYTIPFLISGYVLSVSAARRRHDAFAYSRKILFYVVTFVIVFGAAVSYWNGFRDGKSTKAYLGNAALSLLHYKTASDEELCRLYPNAEFVKQYAPFLEQQGYSVFYAHDAIMK